MKFEKGHPRPLKAGRKKGTPNKITEAVIDLLNEIMGQGKNCDPVEFLARVVANDKEWFGRKGDISLALRMKAAIELSPYRAPKRKAVEITGAGGVSPVIIIPGKAEGQSWEERAQQVRDEQQRNLQERVK